MIPVDWANLNQLRGTELKGELFSLFQSLAVEIQEGESDDPELLAAVPRLADLIAEQPEADSYRELLSTLARSVGLWNYIDKEVADHRDALIAGAVTVPELGNITLHREQIEALNILLSGRNLILSAPTSFGKSILVDILLLSGRYNRVAIVLPTIALLDEFRRRLVARFGSEFDVLMHHSELPRRDKVIFLGTQERLINRTDLGILDLAVVDEFYKLDPNRVDDRSMTLNATVYQLLKRSKQFFFLGPNIEEVRFSPTNKWKFEFLKTRFSTVAVDTFDLRGVEDRDERLKEEAYETKNWPALIFVSSPDKANALARDLTANSKQVGKGADLAVWIDKNYGGRWELGKVVASGVGVHHGRIPRALASRFVTLFNDQTLPILICTSTLIEGVNTAAKSVLIYDKTINKASYDFFTFSNIRGRAGRLGQHHVGRIFLFHTPPSYEDVNINPPLFGDLDGAPDELVVHIEQDDSTDAIGSRVNDLIARLGLTWDEVKRFSSLGFENIAAIKSGVAAALNKGARLSWSARPEYNDIRAVAEVICAVKKPRDFGVKTANQLTMYLNQLRKHGPIRHFFSWHSENFQGPEDTLDNVFKFLRACEFSLPEYFGCVEVFVRKAGFAADYSLFTAEVARWFRPDALKALEEQGVPIQISERFIRSDDTIQSLSRRLRELADSVDPRLDKIEREWVVDALPKQAELDA
jgi:hypothetical protein